jgi:hypothetical protein
LGLRAIHLGGYPGPGPSGRKPPFQAARALVFYRSFEAGERHEGRVQRVARSTGDTPSESVFNRSACSATSRGCPSEARDEPRSYRPALSSQSTYSCEMGRSCVQLACKGGGRRQGIAGAKPTGGPSVPPEPSLAFVCTQLGSTRFAWLNKASPCSSVRGERFLAADLVLARTCVRVAWRRERAQRSRDRVQPDAGVQLHAFGLMTITVPAPRADAPLSPHDRPIDACRSTA